MHIFSSYHQSTSHTGRNSADTERYRNPMDKDAPSRCRSIVTGAHDWGDFGELMCLKLADEDVYVWLRHRNTLGCRVCDKLLYIHRGAHHLSPVTDD